MVLINLASDPQWKLRPVWQAGDSLMTNSEVVTEWHARCEPISLPSSEDASGDGEASVDDEEYFRSFLDEFNIDEIDLIDDAEVIQAHARMDTSLGNRIGLGEVYNFVRDVLLPIIRVQCEDPLTQDVYAGATCNPDQRWLNAGHHCRHLMRVLARVTGPDTKVTYDFTRLLEVAVILVILHEYPASRVEQARFYLEGIYLSIYLSIHPSIHPSIHLSIHLSIHPSIYLSTRGPSRLALSPRRRPSTSTLRCTCTRRRAQELGHVTRTDFTVWSEVWVWYILTDVLASRVSYVCQIAHFLIVKRTTGYHVIMWDVTTVFLCPSRNSARDFREH